MYDNIIIGGGAAGLMTAVIAAKRSQKTLLVEKNEKLGKKLYITGKGRCNITNDCAPEDLFDAVATNPRFLHSAFRALDNKALMHFFEKGGLKLTVEAGRRVFPKSQKASDVTRFFTHRIDASDNVHIRLNTAIQEISTTEGAVTGVRTTQNEYLPARNVLIATGGKSYPLTGSTGDGYTLAAAVGHNITPTRPALVPMTTAEQYDLAGLALKNVEATLWQNNKKAFSRFGEMLFTHDGVGGPIIQNLTAFVTDYMNTALTLDFKPALEHKKLDARLLRDFDKYQNKDIKNALVDLLPARLILPVLTSAGIQPDTKINALKAEQRKRLLQNLKAFPLTPTGTKGFEEAIITAGGVHVKEVSPSTMCSKLVSGLYFAGEVLDVHAITGGYNLQIAFSTAYLAANSFS